MSDTSKQSDFQRWAAAEIAATTAEIKAHHSHLTQPGQLAANLRQGLAEIRAGKPNMSEDPITGEPFPADLDMSTLPAETREDVEDAADREELAVQQCEDTREELADARRALADAQDRVDALEQDLARRQHTADVAQNFLAGTLRAWGLIRTATGYARRPM